MPRKEATKMCHRKSAVAVFKRETFEKTRQISDGNEKRCAADLFLQLSGRINVIDNTPFARNSVSLPTQARAGIYNKETETKRP